MAWRLQDSNVVCVSTQLATYACAHDKSAVHNPHRNSWHQTVHQSSATQDTERMNMHCNTRVLTSEACWDDGGEESINVVRCPCKNAFQTAWLFIINLERKTQHLYLSLTTHVNNPLAMVCRVLPMLLRKVHRTDQSMAMLPYVIASDEHAASMAMLPYVIASDEHAASMQHGHRCTLFLSSFSFFFFL